MAGAVSVLLGLTLGLTGTVFFSEEGTDVRIFGTVSGFQNAGKYAFHIHQYGDTRSDCSLTDGHFNPLDKNHGAPTDRDRHVGDLGNIEADAQGVASFNFTDSVIKFGGTRGIIGRSVVIHAGEDTGAGSAKSGTIACGVIGLTGTLEE